MPQDFTSDSRKVSVSLVSGPIFTASIASSSIFSTAMIMRLRASVGLPSSKAEERPVLQQRLEPAHYARLLKSCGTAKDIVEGRRIHRAIAGSEHHRNIYLANLLVEMYGKCGSLEDALKVFDKIDRPNKFSWNIMIAAYAHNGHLEEARRMFDRMAEKNVVSWNAMIAAYAQRGHMQEARALFEEMPERNVVSWNALISGYAQNGIGQETVLLFKMMDLEGMQPNEVTFVSVFDACASTSALEDGKALHGLIVQAGLDFNVVVGTSLINMYGKCRRLEDARAVFNGMQNHNVVSWTAMLAAYAQNGHVQEARSMFEKMRKRDEVSWTTMVTAYAQSGLLEEARDVFDKMPKANVVAGTAMITAYARHGLLQEAEAVYERMPKQDLVSRTAMVAAYAQNGHLNAASEMFNTMPKQDSVSWNAMIAAYAQNGDMEGARRMFERMRHWNLFSWNAMITGYSQNRRGKEAIELFRRMDLEGFRPDEVTFAGIIDACTTIPALAEGKLIHGEIIDTHLELDLVVGTALINMYGRCGILDIARGIFDRSSCGDVVVWNAMIAAYARNGYCKEALEVFRIMDCEGIQPDTVTFMAILFACSHAGWLDKGWVYFSTMNGDYSIVPTAKHYTCMTDLLGRSGRLNDAEELLNSLPFEPGIIARKMLLSSCKVQGESQRGARIAKQVSEMDPTNAVPYVLLSNMYASETEGCT